MSIIIKSIISNLEDYTKEVDVKITKDYKLNKDSKELTKNKSNLVVNELSGSLRSNYGYDFDTTVGGVLDTSYTCETFDKDGIELAYQSYSDSYEVNEKQFFVYQAGFMKAIESAYNPNLSLFTIHSYCI